jgi:hypothetical protein
MLTYFQTDGSLQAACLNLVACADVSKLYIDGVSVYCQPTGQVGQLI